MTEILLLLAIIIPLHIRTEHRLTKIEAKLDKLNGGEKNVEPQNSTGKRS